MLAPFAEPRCAVVCRTDLVALRMRKLQLDQIRMPAERIGAGGALSFSLRARIDTRRDQTPRFVAALMSALQRQVGTLAEADELLGGLSRHFACRRRNYSVSPDGKLRKSARRQIR
jgi:hypothetical protein